MNQLMTLRNWAIGYYIVETFETLVVTVSLVYNYVSLIHTKGKLMAQTKINANGIEIGVMGGSGLDDSYISLTDIAKYKDFDDPRVVITNWMSSYSTIDFLAVWEEIHNPDDFNRLEFQSVRNERGRLIMTPKQ